MSKTDLEKSDVELAQLLQDRGYDGIVYKNTIESDDSARHSQAGVVGNDNVDVETAETALQKQKISLSQKRLRKILILPIRVWMTI